MITLTINGKKVTAREGQTILEAARVHGIFIPTLCHNDALKPYGACRLCIVEIEQHGRTVIESSCTYPVAEKLMVKTNSPRVLEGRRIVLELLLARCPNVKLLQELAAEYQVAKIPAQWSRDNSYCILCGLCVRACNEVVQAGAIGFAGTGIEKIVDSPFHAPAESCVGCGSCAFVCPTGIIKINDIKQTMLCMPGECKQEGPKREISNWQVEHSMKICEKCGNPFAPLPLLKKIAEERGYQMDFFKFCPSCRSYPVVDQDLCTACNACIVVCPVGAAQFIADGEGQKSQIFEQNCCGCHSCTEVCGWGAVKAR